MIISVILFTAILFSCKPISKDVNPLLSEEELEIDQLFYEFGLSPISSHFGATSRGRICITDFGKQDYACLTLLENILEKSSYVMSTPRSHVQHSYNRDSISKTLRLLQIAENLNIKRVEVSTISSPIRYGVLCELAVAGTPYSVRLFFSETTVNPDVERKLDKALSPIKLSYKKLVEELSPSFSD